MLFKFSRDSIMKKLLDTFISLTLLKYSPQTHLILSFAVKRQ